MPDIVLGAMDTCMNKIDLSPKNKSLFSFSFHSTSIFLVNEIMLVVWEGVRYYAEK